MVLRVLRADVDQEINRRMSMMFDARAAAYGREKIVRSRCRSFGVRHRWLPTVLLAGIAALVGASAGSVIAGGATGIDGVATDVPGDDLPLVARGEAVYRESCASCHGLELEGQPNWRTRDANGLLPAPPHDAEGHTWHHADDLLFEIVKYGPGAVIGDATYRSAMPAYDGVLSDADIVAALAYIKHSWPAEQRRWQAEVDGATGEFEKPVAPREGPLERLFR